MRIRFQRLFMGQRVLDSDGQVLWHDKFASKEAAEEFLRIGRAARCVILRDQRRNVLRLYGGTSASCVLAQSSVLSFIGSCELQRFTVPCPTAAWKPLLLQGLAAVKAATGASMVSLDIVKRGLMIEGDRNAAASVADFLASLARLHQMGHFARPHLGTICPVCCCTAGDDVEAGDLATVHLACSHTYCALASTTCWPRPLMVIRAAVQSFQSHATQTNVASRYRFSISRETLRQVNLSHYCGLRWIAMLSRGLPAFRPVRHRVAETSIPHLPTRLLRARGSQRASFIAVVVGHRSAWRAKQRTTRASLAPNIARKVPRRMSS